MVQLLSTLRPTFRPGEDEDKGERDQTAQRLIFSHPGLKLPFQCAFFFAWLSKVRTLPLIFENLGLDLEIGFPLITIVLGIVTGKR